jgi:hypothetical protein
MVTRRRFRPGLVPLWLAAFQVRAWPLLLDPFATPATYDVNANVATRQSGPCAGTTYLETPLTAAGQSQDSRSAIEEFRRVGDS